MTDMVDLVTDPELGAGPFQWVRLTETVNERGRAELASETHDGMGIIQPAPGKELERLPEADRGKDTIEVFTPAALTAGGAGMKPDRILHNGGTYRVSLAEAWPTAGYTKALAVWEQDA